jgi:hypothetical protein
MAISSSDDRAAVTKSWSDLGIKIPATWCAPWRYLGDHSPACRTVGCSPTGPGPARSQAPSRGAPSRHPSRAGPCSIVPLRKAASKSKSSRIDGENKISGPIRQRELAHPEGGQSHPETRSHPRIAYGPSNRSRPTIRAERPDALPMVPFNVSRSLPTLTPRSPCPRDRPGPYLCQMSGVSSILKLHAHVRARQRIVVLSDQRGQVPSRM